LLEFVFVTEKNYRKEALLCKHLDIV